MRHVPRLLCVGIGALIALIAFHATSRAATTAGAKALESRLYAPCCYGGTLDIHESELARALRDEIDSRLARGESSDAIQADFVARYGDKVLAARSDSPLRAMGIGIGLAATLGAIGLIVVVRRWTRRPSESTVTVARTSARDALDDSIDAELAELDS